MDATRQKLVDEAKRQLMDMFKVDFIEPWEDTDDLIITLTFVPPTELGDGTFYAGFAVDQEMKPELVDYCGDASGRINMPPTDTKKYYPCDDEFNASCPHGDQPNCRDRCGLGVDEDSPPTEED